MGKNNKIGKLKELKKDYDQYILPTKQCSQNPYFNVERDIIHLCKLLQLDCIKTEFEIFLSEENYMIIKKIYINRKKFYDKEIELYSYKQVKCLFNFINLNRAIKEKLLKIATYINGYYFYKEEVDNYLKIYNESVYYSELYTLIKAKLRGYDIHDRHIYRYVRNYPKVDFKLNNNMGRFYKKYINNLINDVKYNYVYKRRGNYCKDLTKYFIKYIPIEQIPLISDENSVDYFDISKLRKIESKYFTYVLPELIKHIMQNCNENHIKWFSNEKFDNIYISKNDINIYINMYKIWDTFAYEHYYTTKQVKKLFGGIGIDKIIKYSGSTTVRHMLYVDKQKTDELLKIYENTTPLHEVEKQIGFSAGRITDTLNELGLDYIKRSKLPIASCDTLIYKKDINTIKDILSHKDIIRTEKDRYKKYKYIINDINCPVNLSRTSTLFNKFVIERLNSLTKKKGEPSILARLYNIVISKLGKDIFLLSDPALENIIQLLPTKTYKQEFAFFINYCKNETNTVYKNEYIIDSSLNRNKLNTDAYKLEQWRSFGQLLFDTKSTKFKELLKKAIDNRIYAGTWLYCAMHFVCAFRTGDIFNLPCHRLEKILMLNGYEVIEAIKEGTFTEGMSQLVVNDVYQIINALRLNASKSHKYNKNKLKFVVSEKFVYVIGMLIALCKAHNEIMVSSNIKDERINTDIETPMITEHCTKFEVYNNFFGTEYKGIFGDETFSNRRGNKTYLCFIQTLSQEYGWGDGYYLSSIARGHKISKRSGIAEVNQVYLENLNKDNDVDKVTNALIDRGIFGFVPYLMLKIINGKNVKEIDILKQNKLIQELLPLKPYKLEKLLNINSNFSQKTNELIKKLMTTPKEDILSILIKISQGDVPSKMEYSHCIIKAVEKDDCAYPNKKNCIGCEFHILETYFLFEFCNKFKQLLNNLMDAEYEYDKRRLTSSLINSYLPILQEATHFIGKDRVNAFVDFNLIKENIFKLNKKNKLILG